VSFDVLAGIVFRIQNGEHTELYSGTKLVASVAYYDEPARGDNGVLVPGATTGEFIVTWANGAMGRFSHGPDIDAKWYVSDRVASACITALELAGEVRL